MNARQAKRKEGREKRNEKRESDWKGVFRGFVDVSVECCRGVT